MTTFRNIQEIERVGMRWTIVNFVPAQPAFDWPEPRGQKGTLYAVGCGEFTKIGMSKNFENRFKNLNAAVPYELTRILTRSVPLAGMAYAEAWLLNHFRPHHAKNEWFKIDRSLLRAGFAKAVLRAEVYEQCSAEWSANHWAERAAIQRAAANPKSDTEQALELLAEIRAKEAEERRQKKAARA